MERARQALCDVSDSVAAAAVASGPMQAVARFASVERVLAVSLLSIPLWLILLDENESSIRGSVSAYYDMTPPQAYYVPITVAAMMFFFNGLVKSRRFYNVALGVLLTVVLLFNEDGASGTVHYIAAAGFFLLNAAVIIWFSNDVDKNLRNLMIAVAVVTLVLWVAVDAFTTFWAEWVSLGVIATHFVLDSIGFRGYSTAADRHRSST